LEIQQQMQDNITWIKGVQANKTSSAGSQARILYADAEGRKTSPKLNQAIAKGDIGTVVLGRDHHDVLWNRDSPIEQKP
jgi:urocanate hydratase